jgi:fido (protein-threonine AMPylation protein)
MSPDDRVSWDYATHPDYKIILKRKAIDVLVKLRHGEIDGMESAADSRGIHRYLFSELTPPGCDYFAGHYRGEAFPGLKHYVSGVREDSRVGYPPEVVASHMAGVAQTVRFGLQVLDTLHQSPDRQRSRVDRLLDTVAFASRVFEEVLRIHPYANGNGHAARFIVWAILGRYGYWPARFPIDPRPQGNSYYDCIVKYRNGDTQPLERYLLECIIG